MRNFLRKDYYSINKSQLHLSRKDYQYLKTFDKTDYRTTTIEFNKRKITFNSPFWFLHSINEIFVHEVYKINFNKPNPLIVDCGANIGLSVMYFKLYYPNCCIKAFEADPKVFTQLQNNLNVYNYSDVNLINAAVWKEDGKISFMTDGSVGGKIDQNNDSQNELITSIRLKKYLNQKVDFLKIDIEGSEYEVLKDCSDLLYNVDYLFVEFHSFKDEKQKLHELLGWLCEAGFQYYIKEAWNNMTYPFLKKYNDYFQMQLNIFCHR